MEIHFRDKKLRQLCENEALAQARLGATCARFLMAQLKELKCARNVADLHAGKPHPLKGERSGQFSVSLSGGFRLVFSPYPPQTATPPLDWAKVSNICIDFIGDYHD